MHNSSVLDASVTPATRGAIVTNFVYAHSALVVSVAVALLLFPSYWSTIGLLLGLLWFGSRWRVVGKVFPTTPANIPLFILMGLTILTLILTPARDRGLPIALQLFAGLIVVFGLWDQVKTSADLWRATALVSLLGLAFAMVAPLTVAWPQYKLFDLPILLTTTLPQLKDATNANILAGTLAPIVPLTFALIARRELRLRILGIVSLCTIGLVLVLLQSRGAFFAVGIGVAVWATLHWRWALPLIPLGVLAALALNYSLGGVPPTQFFYGKIGTTTGGTLIERQALWGEALTVLRQSPILGAGLGVQPVIENQTFNHVHNLFLQVGWDMGLIGITCLVVVLALAIVALWQTYGLHRERALAIALLSAFSILFVHSIGDVVVWGSKGSVVLWLMLGLALVFDKKELAL